MWGNFAVSARNFRIHVQMRKVNCKKVYSLASQMMQLLNIVLVGLKGIEKFLNPARALAKVSKIFEWKSWKASWIVKNTLSRAPFLGRPKTKKTKYFKQ